MPLDKALLEVKGRVHLIEPFGAFDGPGLRFVLFLQGCPLACKFCHNRTSWSRNSGETYSVSEILKKFNQYKLFYGTTPKLTVSGGEPLFQLEFLDALFKTAKSQGIETCLDTSAGLFQESEKEKYTKILKNTDLVLLDLKHSDPKKHLWLTGRPLEPVYAFARFLDEQKKDIVVRQVIIPGINLYETQLQNLRNFLDSLSSVSAIEVLKYHTHGAKKWTDLGLNYPLKGVREANQADFEFANKILTKGYKFKKCRIFSRN